MSNTETALRVYEVLFSHMGSVEASLIALAKRAVRKGLTPVTHSWGKPFTSIERIPHPEYGWKVDKVGPVTRVALSLFGEIPRYAGWSFVASLEHLDGENITRCVPGATLPTEYRNRGPHCDHCKASRRRNDTFVLSHTNGTHMQVGSTCIGDFLGTDGAGNLASAAMMLADFSSLAESGCEGFGATSDDMTLESYLAFVAYEIREGGWVSRTKAREDDTGRTTATADRAMSAIKASPRKVHPTEADIALAVAAEAWAESLSDSEVAKDSGDYLHNCRAIARRGIVNHRSAGLAGSIVSAYQRAIGDAKRKAIAVVSMHVGTVGERSTRKLTLDFLTGYATDYGYTTICKFLDSDGACFVWKASNTDLAKSDVGNVYYVTGTVKSHGEYNGTKQTMLTICKVSTEAPAVKVKRARKVKAEAAPLSKTG